MKIIQGMLLLLIALVSVQCNNSGNNKNKKKNVLEDIDSTYINQFFEQHKEYKKYRAKVMNFYRKRDFEVAWSEKGKPLPHTTMFMNVVQNLKEDGIAYQEPEGYSLEDKFQAVSHLKKRKTPYVTNLRNELDLMLTLTYFEYAPKLWQGVMDPNRLEWFVKRDKIDYEQMLDSMLNTRQRKNPFTNYASTHHQYEKLREVLRNYKTIIDNKEDTLRVRSSKVFSPGETSPDVNILVAKLQQLGDLNGKRNYTAFDEDVESALKHFQERHGINATGSLDKVTASLLNIPLKYRTKQILVNMERWRWLPHDLEQDYIWVNIPQFELTVFEENRPVKTMNVIVGEQGNETTIFNNSIKYIVVNPYWNIPQSIAVEEILPILQRTPKYLEQQQIEVGLTWKFKEKINTDTIDWNRLNEENFSYKLRKKPGKDNPLGRMKFLFPNQFSIYLHDTPNNTLFSEGKRGFSHGCIRIEKPLELAEYLIEKCATKKPVNLNEILREEDDLANEKPNEEEEIPEIWIALEKPFPVYLVYFTTWVDDDDAIHFTDDIYKHDSTMMSRLFKNPAVAL